MYVGKTKVKTKAPLFPDDVGFRGAFLRTQKMRLFYSVFSRKSFKSAS